MRRPDDHLTPRHCWYRHCWLWMIALLVGGGGSPGVWAAAEPSPTPKALEVQPEDLQRARTLVQQLGSDSYTQREQAQTELAKMGRLALTALQEALAAHPSPEVRQRCASLLPAAIEDDINVRLEVFLADTAGRYHHQLPGWEQFRAVVCDEWRWCGWTLGRRSDLEPAARKLYADMLRSPSNRQLLFFWDDPHGNLTSVLADRRLELTNWRNTPKVIINGQLVSTPQRPPELVEWLAVLFVEQFSPAPPAGRFPLAAALVNSPVREASRRNDATGEVVRNLTLAWALRQRDPQELYYLVINADNLGFSALTLPLAQHLLRHPGAPAHYKVLAFNRLLQQPHPRLLPLLESLFQDESVVTNMTVVRVVNGQRQQERIIVELRDAALAAALHICQISPTDYGFIDRMPQQQKTAYVQNRYYFPDDKVRQQAFGRWQRERPQPPPSP